MPNEIQRKNLKKLIAALRSGNYQQARGSLRTPFGFCCLGVACDASHLAEWKGRTYFEYLEYGGMLPEEIVNFYGFQNRHGFYIKDRDERLQTLANLNDQGMPFAQIADLIEHEYNLGA